MNSSFVQKIQTQTLKLAKTLGPFKHAKANVAADDEKVIIIMVAARQRLTITCTATEATISHFANLVYKSPPVPIEQFLKAKQLDVNTLTREIRIS